LLIHLTVMAALGEVLKTSFIIFCLLGISLSIENGKLHKIHILDYRFIVITCVKIYFNFNIGNHPEILESLKKVNFS
jgi:uncharacterized protein YjaG (DUF416 family)